MQIETLDLDFGKTPRTIASFLVTGPEGPVLVETGPASTLPTLLGRLEEHGLRPKDVRHVLVTHIHLDHAGAAGWWARQGATVYVHSVGAPHLIDPSRLLISAGRIYGERMDELWGNTEPAPAERVVPIDDGAVVSAGGLEFRAIDSPGHAGHHHVFRLGDVAFAGDAAGIHLGEERWIDVPAPPPEFNLELWKGTLDRLRREKFHEIYRTHFGPTTGVNEQLDRFEAVLDDAVRLVRELLDQGLERDAILERYVHSMRERAAAEGVDEEEARAFELANPRFMSVDGIIRYWKRRERDGGAR